VSSCVDRKKITFAFPLMHALSFDAHCARLQTPPIHSRGSKAAPHIFLQSCLNGLDAAKRDVVRVKEHCWIVPVPAVHPGPEILIKAIRIRGEALAQSLSTM
jgi:hypothetical protein